MATASHTYMYSQLGYSFLHFTLWSNLLSRCATIGALHETTVIGTTNTMTDERLQPPVQPDKTPLCQHNTNASQACMQETCKASAQSEPAMQNAWTPLSFKLALQLAAPHTWPAAIIPFLYGFCVSFRSVDELSYPAACIMLIIVILFQSAANTLNDYFDYKKGADSKNDFVEESDAVLVYHHINPRSVKRLAIAYVVMSFILGLYIVYESDIIPLVIGIIGALVLVFYSAGKTPLSYLPLGELSSGVVMGGLIPSAVTYGLTQSYSSAFALSLIPLILLVALIMFTNNLSDREKDLNSHRRTLAGIMSREQAKTLYVVGVILTIVAEIFCLESILSADVVVVVAFVLCVAPFASALIHNPITPEMRLKSMPQILTFVVICGVFYCLGCMIY